MSKLLFSFILYILCLHLIFHLLMVSLLAINELLDSFICITYCLLILLVLILILILQYHIYPQQMLNCTIQYVDYGHKFNFLILHSCNQYLLNSNSMFPFYFLLCSVSPDTLLFYHLPCSFLHVITFLPNSFNFYHFYSQI